MSSAPVTNTINPPTPPASPSAITQMANVLPRFLMLYKPLGEAAALGLGAVRTVFSLNELKNLSQQDQPIPPRAVINTLVDTASLAATAFVHPVGMLITAIKDLATEVESLKTHLDTGRYTEAMECGAKVLSNALYLSVLAVGNVQLSIAALALQIGLGVYSAKKAISQGSYIEAAGHLAMTLILGKQMSSLTTQLIQEQRRLSLKSHLEERISTLKSEMMLEKTQSEFTLQAGYAQYGESDYLNAVRVERGISLEEAKRIASSDPEIAYFFWMKGWGMALLTDRNTPYDPANDPLGLITRDSYYRYDSEGFGSRDMRYFTHGDTVFFKDMGKMWLGTAPGSADTYIKNF